MYDGLAASGNVSRDAGAVYVVFGKPGPDTPSQSCFDNDVDGFNEQGRTCGPRDCNDQDPSINPLAPEICTDGIDNNCDGFIDFQGEDADLDYLIGNLYQKSG
ncbi:MAG: putative metal-binding motif-containing protein, partial [Nitrospinales bacterium]